MEPTVRNRLTWAVVLAVPVSLTFGTRFSADVLAGARVFGVLLPVAVVLSYRVMRRELPGEDARAPDRLWLFFGTLLGLLLASGAVFTRERVARVAALPVAARVEATLAELAVDPRLALPVSALVVAWAVSEWVAYRGGYDAVRARFR